MAEKWNHSAHDEKGQGDDGGIQKRHNEEVAVRLRKKKDRKHGKNKLTASEEEKNAGVPEDDTVYSEETFEPTKNDLLQRIITNMNQESNAMILKGVCLTRKMLARTYDIDATHASIDCLISAGIMDKCVEFLKMKNEPEIQFEASWVLTNIAAGTSTHTKAVVNAGAIERFVDLLGCPDPRIVGQVCWAIRNCVVLENGEGPELREAVLSKGVIPHLVTLVETHANNISVLRNVSWTFAYVCQGNSPTIRPCLPGVVRLVHLEDMIILADACWALAYLADGDINEIQEIIDTGVVPRIVTLLNHTHKSVSVPCVRALGNILTGTHEQTQLVLDYGVLGIFKKFLESSDPKLVKFTVWILSNITAGTENQISAVIESGAIPLVVNIIETGDFRTQKHAIWMVTHVSTLGTIEQVMTLCQNGVVAALCKSLALKDWSIVVQVIEALASILNAVKKAEGDELFYRISLSIEECGGLEQIEELQNHENLTVYNTAYNFIVTYFGDMEEEELVTSGIFFREKEQNSSGEMNGQLDQPPDEQANH